MRKAKGTLQGEDSRKGLVLKMALELSMSKWKVAFGWEEKSRYVTIGARDLDRLQEEIGKARKRFGLEEGVGVLSCYEAGRDGFWLHRYLRSKGVENLVVDSSSIEVSRRKRRAKTDRLDARKLLGMLVRHGGGERGFWSVVRVPGEEEEGARHLHRELEVLRKEQYTQRSAKGPAPQYLGVDPFGIRSTPSDHYSRYWADWSRATNQDYDERAVHRTLF